MWRIDIQPKAGHVDPLSVSILKDIQDLGVLTVKRVDIFDVFILDGDMVKDDVEKIAFELLVDPITQKHTIHSKSVPKKSISKNTHVIEVKYNTGVMDPVESSTLKGIRDLKVGGVTSVQTAKRYIFEGQLTQVQLDMIADKVLMNKLIQHVVKDGRDLQSIDGVDFTIEPKVDVISVGLIDASEKELLDISEKGQLFLNLKEMKAIQEYYKELKRDPTDIELETIAQTWSEHCHHKTFRGNIDYEQIIDGKKKKIKIKSLIKETIFNVTKKLNPSWCVSVFHDNAGVIKFDKDYNVCFKVETHNHPSALEPFGGANTGVGGVIRDTLGTGLGAKPICNTDVFCFASPDFPLSKLPAGSLHPKRVLKGVVAGVRDYGNKMGIPTVNGAIVFDDHFVGNPLVFCGNVGLIPKGMEKKEARPGDLIVVAGGRTGRDGIHGATFSSGELTSESEVVSSGAVQIGNPIEEKKVADVMIQARDAGLYTCVTDCGAGGLSSAVGEMGADIGASVDLETVPLKYHGLKYMEIWISESQERMVFAVPPKKIKKFLALFEAENVEAAVIGTFTDSKRLELFYCGRQVCDLSMHFMHDGIPKITKKAVWEKVHHKTLTKNEPANLNTALKKCLSHLNVCSKEWVVRQYDHEVQGGSVIKPFVGLTCDGPSDAAVVRPRLDSEKGIVVSNGININFGKIDPYWMAASCIDEAIRQIIAVGGDLDRIALLDNFCWGNPDKPDRLGGLVRTAQGCHDIAYAFGTPFISGKDSLYNEYTQGKKSIAIPGTILISALGQINNINTAVTMDFKQPGNLIYVIGTTYDELGGSIYLSTMKLVGNNVPKVDVKKAMKTYKALHEAIQKGMVRSAHDCSEGGLGVAVAEMAFAGHHGATIDLAEVIYEGEVKRNDHILFSESNSRLIVEVSPEDQKAFESQMKSIDCSCIGRVTATQDLIICGYDGQSSCVDMNIELLRQEWKAPLNLG